MNIRVYVSTDEQSLFGSEQPPEDYDTDSLLSMVKSQVQARYPDAEVEVYSGNFNHTVELEDAPDRQGQMIEAVIEGIQHEAWQSWLEQFQAAA